MSDDLIRTRIWLEEPELGNEFAAKAAYCHGYDVYGEMLSRARWVDMLYLLFRGEAPSAAQADTLETLAVALANPGPRDAAVHAAMCGGVGGSPSASCLMAALAVGAGGLLGARDVFLAMEAWAQCATDLSAWQQLLKGPSAAKASIWPQLGHAPGFDPNADGIAMPVMQTLAALASADAGPRLRWLEINREVLETAAGRPLAMSGVAAAALADLGFTAEQGEMLHLLLRLPGAAAHALEQRHHGYKKFPFFSIELDDTGREEA